MIISKTEAETCYEAVGDEAAQNAWICPLRNFLPEIAQMILKKACAPTRLLLSLKTSPSTLPKSSSPLLMCMASADLPSKKNKLYRFWDDAFATR